MTRTPSFAPASARSFATCTQSSRVGTTTRACGTSLVRSAASPSHVAAGCSAGGVTRCSSGTPKPRVLPMPVRAWPMTSSPAKRQRERQLLDREGALDAGLGERGDDLGADAELGEGGGLGPDRGAGLQGVRLLGQSAGAVGVRGWVVLSGMLSASTDRMIASLRAQEPVRLIDRRRRSAQAGEPTRRCTHQVSRGSRDVLPAASRVGAHPFGRCAAAQSSRSMASSAADVTDVSPQRWTPPAPIGRHGVPGQRVGQRCPARRDRPTRIRLAA